MEQRLLGRTGIPVSLLGMGGLFVSQVGGHDRDQACQAVRRALELGVNYVDTAPGYADSEEVLGLALAGASQPYLISTKLGGNIRPYANVHPLKFDCPSLNYMLYAKLF